jgi:hypothetical protein
VKSVVARLLFIFAALVLPLTNAFGLAYGATRDEVVKELGQPLAHAQLGSREILTYPKKVQVELEDGRVVSADHIVLKIVDPTPTPIPTENPVEKDTPVGSTPTPSSAPTIAPTPAPAQPTPSPEPTLAPTPIPTPVPTAPPAATPEPTRAGINFSVSAKPAATSAPTSNPTVAPTPTVKPALNVDSFKPVSLFDASELPLAGKIMLLVFHFGVTLMAVYFAFRIWNVDALTSGIIIIALIDTALHVLFEALGPMTSGLSTMSAVENGIPGVLMIFTVRHFSFGKKIPEAVRVAAAVKAAVFFVKLIATAALLDFVFPVH